MSAYDFMKNIGLTNADSPEYGEMASAKKERRVVSALCSCGYYHPPKELKKPDNCPRCRKALLWESYSEDGFDSAVFALKMKTAQKEADNILANHACKEITGEVMKTVPDFTPIKWEQVKKSHQKVVKMETVEKAEVDPTQRLLKVSSKLETKYFKVCL